jgi:hypothetical protein
MSDAGCTSTIRCEVALGIAHLILHRPQSGNIFTSELLTQLAEATQRRGASSTRSRRFLSRCGT